MHERVFRAVLELDEPYRSTLLHRYLDELSAAEIARREEIPGDTVRSRIRRGLAILRQRFDAEHGGNRGAWMTLLGLPLRPSAPLVPLGELVMTKTLKIAAAAVVAGGAIGWVWHTVSSPGEPAGPSGGGEVAELSALPSTSPGTVTPDLEAPSVETGSGERGPLIPSVESGLRGRVVRRGDGIAVGETTISTIGLDDRKLTEVGRADEEGAFELRPPPGPELNLVFRHDGYRRQIVAPTEIPRGEGAFLEVELARTGRLEIIVTDDAGEPVADAGVRVREGASMVASFPIRSHATTNEAGACVVDELPCATSLSVRFYDEVGGFVPRAGEGVEIDPAIGWARLEMTWVPPGAISGRVVNADDSPASVPVHLETTTGYRSQATTLDETGRFRFERVWAGAHRVAPQSPAIVPVAVDVLPGEEVELDTIRLSDGAVFAGWIRSRFELGDQRFRVQLLREHGEVGKTLGVGEDGNFETRIPEGSLLVRVLAEDVARLGTRTRYWYEPAGGELGEVARQRAEAPRDGLEIWIDEGVGVIEGAVPDAEDSDPAPVLEFDVSGLGPPEVVSDMPAFRVASRWIEPGRFRTPAILAGRYPITIRLEGRRPCLLEEIEVRPGETTTLDAFSFAEAQLGGYVTNPAEERIPDAVVTLYSDQQFGRESRVVTSPGGWFSFPDLQQGRYSIQANLAGWGASEPAPVNVPAGETEITLVLQPEGRVFGRMERDGQAVVGERVVLQRFFETPGSGAVMPMTEVITDAKGAFAFDHLPPDHYNVWTDTVMFDLRLAPGEEREITLRADSTPARPRLFFEGMPLEEGVGIIVEMLDSPAASRGCCWHVKTDEEGRIPLSLVPGRLLLTPRWPAEVGKCGIGWIDVDPYEPPERIDLCDGELILESDLDSLAAPPDLVVLAIDDVRTEGAIPLTLRKRRTAEGPWKYIGVPPNASLRLEGIDERGRWTTKTLRSPEHFPARIAWP